MPKGEFDFYQAKEACANQGAKMYAPESKIQRLATMTWFQKYIAVSSCALIGYLISSKSDLIGCFALRKKSFLG